jgi:hypothetical protein
LKNRYIGEKSPVFSIDAKSREWLGTCYRKGRTFRQKPVRAFDPGVSSWRSGKIVPHGIEDPIRNHGHRRGWPLMPEMK